MVFIGLLIALLGFAISFLSLGMTTSVNARMIMVLIGIAVSFTGIIAVMNRAYLKNAIWRK
jgi:cytochrome c biogenesis protein CcdA